MSKRFDYKKIYSVRKHEDGSVREIVFNYRNAFRYWVRFESPDAVSSYEIKIIFAIVVFVATVLVIISDIQIYNNTHIFVSSIASFANSNNFINIELIALNIVSCMFLISCIPSNARDEDTYLFSYYALRNSSRNRPNFILEYDILNGLSDDVVKMYIEVFRIRYDSLRPEIERYKTTETWTILAIAVTVIMSYINDPNAVVLAVSLCLAVLIAYFLDNLMTKERFVLLTDCALYDMILQDLCDIRIIRAFDSNNHL